MRGTSLYCGLGYFPEQMEEHLKKAKKAGIDLVFSSLQLPESNKDDVLRDFPTLSSLCKKYGMKLDTDISPETAKLFGINFKDIDQIKKFGADIIRLDYGFTLEETAELSKNDIGLTIELNATGITEEKLENLVSLGANKQNIHFCHNYYPMPGSGLTKEYMLKKNELIHSYGFEVCGFISSKNHRRPGVGKGLATLECHRNADVFTAAEELLLLKCDDVCFGDDLASEKELKQLCFASKDTVYLRMACFAGEKLNEWLTGTVFIHTNSYIEDYIRASRTTAFKDGFDSGLSCRRYKGDIVICRPSLKRYAGELHIMKKDCPRDDDFVLIGRIADEDLSILDIMDNASCFAFIDVTKQNEIG